jgi:hypothetical protein
MTEKAIHLPLNFKIPKKEDLQRLLDKIGSRLAAWNE